MGHFWYNQARKWTGIHVAEEEIPMSSKPPASTALPVLDTVTDRLAAQAEHEKAQQIRRLRQFIAIDTPLNGLALLYLIGLYIVYPLDALLLLIPMVLVNTALVLWAGRLARQGRIEAAVTAICGGIWMVILVVSFLVPLIHPVLAVV